MPQIPSLDHLKTAKDRNKYPAQELEVVEPVEIVLGEEIVSNGSERNGSVKVKEHTFQYVSLIKVLEKVLNQIDIFSQIENTHRSTDGKMRDFYDGEECHAPWSTSTFFCLHKSNTNYFVL